MPSITRTTLSLLFLLFLFSTALAQTPRDTALPIEGQPAPKQSATQSSIPIVTATAGNQMVRYATLGEVNQTRLQVFSADGTQVFDSDFKLGNLIDWQLADSQGTHLTDGSYLFLVSVKDFSGTLTQKYGAAQIEQGTVTLRQSGRDELSSAQATALQSNQQAATLAPVDRVGVSANAPPQTSSTTGTPTLAGVSTPTTSNLTAGGENVSGTGTANQVTKWADTNGALTDSAIAEINGNVGIGITNPSYRLVVGTDIGPGLTTSDLTVSRGPGQSVSIFAGASGANGMNFGWDQNSQRAFVNAPVQSPITFTHGGATERMRIETNGNIGMGTPTPTQRLEVVGNLKISGNGSLIFPDNTVQTTAGGGGLSSVSHDTTLTGNGTAGSPLGVAPLGVGTAQLANSAVTLPKIGTTNTAAAGQVLTTNGSTISWATPGSGNSQWTTSGSNIFYNVANGNVGIGTTNPNAKLTVVGDTGASSAVPAPPTLDVQGGAGGAGTVTGGTGSLVTIKGGNGGAVSAAANNGATGGVAGAVNIQAGTGGVANNAGNRGGQGGNLTIAAGSGGTNNDANGLGGFGGNLSLDAGAGGPANQGTIGTPGTVSIGNVGLVGVGATPTAGGAKLQVFGTLTIQAPGGSGSPLCLSGSFIVVNCATSSQKYKSQIHRLGDGLNLVERLRPVTFKWKETGEPDFGLVAEEVNKVSPRLNTYTAKGEVEGVRYDRLAVVLINAVQQQQAQIQQQQAQIQMLKQMVCKNHARTKACRGKAR